MAKEKSITELKDEKKNLSARSKAIIEKVRGEKRQFNAEENEELGAVQVRMAEINIEIEERESENRQQGKRHPQPGKERFSLRRAILNLSEGNQQHDADAPVLEAAAGEAVEKRSRNSIFIPVETRAAFTAATESALGVNIDQEQQEMILPLQANLVLAQAGARFMTGLKGDIYWPKYSGSNVAWSGENDEAPDGAGTFSKGTEYKPIRLTAYVDISNMLLVQENKSIETIIRQTLAQAISQKVESTAFGAAAHVDGIPDGMFQALPTDAGAMSWARVVALETNADVANALFGNLAYIMHPTLLGKAKTIVKDASGAGGFVFGNDGAGMLNGYRALRSTNLPKGLREGKDECGIVFGNWNDYFIGQWGSIELKVDPYTQMLKDTTRLVINSYWNMGFVRKESFSFATMK